MESHLLGEHRSSDTSIQHKDFSSGEYKNSPISCDFKRWKKIEKFCFEKHEKKQKNLMFSEKYLK